MAAKKRRAASGKPAAPKSVKSSARSTTSGPARGRAAPADLSDAAVSKFEATEALAAGMPHNANKPLEHGAAARDPQPGATVEPVRSRFALAARLWAWRVAGVTIWRTRSERSVSARERSGRQFVKRASGSRRRSRSEGLRASTRSPVTGRAAGFCRALSDRPKQH